MYIMSNYYQQICHVERRVGSKCFRQSRYQQQLSNWMSFINEQWLLIEIKTMLVTQM